MHGVEVTIHEANADDIRLQHVRCNAACLKEVERMQRCRQAAKASVNTWRKQMQMTATQPCWNRTVWNNTDSGTGWKGQQSCGCYSR